MKLFILTVIFLMSAQPNPTAQEMAFLDFGPKVTNSKSKSKSNSTLLEKLNKYLANQVKYPPLALENQVEELTNFSCYFDQQGKVYQIEFKNDIDVNIEKTIRRTLNTMPKFVAAANQKITTSLYFRLK